MLSSSTVLTVDGLIERLGRARSRGGAVVVQVWGLGKFRLTQTYDRTRRPTRGNANEGAFELISLELSDHTAIQKERLRLAGCGLERKR